MPALRSARIAVVDGDRMTLAILGAALRAGGHEVLELRSGEEALSALWDSPVDLLVVDLLLPRMSGIDLAREVRARPWASAMPVLGVTALRWSAEQVLAIEEAMAPARLIRKPVDPDDLRAVVRGMLDLPSVSGAAA